MNSDDHDDNVRMEYPMNNVPRPLVLTVLCWFLVVSAMINIAMAPSLLSNPLGLQLLSAAAAPPWVLIVIAVVSAAIQGAAGGVMLVRRGWGRMLYIIATPLQTLASYAAYGFELGGIMLLGLAFYLGIVAVLMRRDVTAYFTNDPGALPVGSGHGTYPPAEPVNVGRRIASIVLLVPATIILSTGFLVLGALPELGLGAFIMTGFMMFISALFVVPALYFWGWSRSAIVLGVLMAVVGGELLMIGVVVQQTMSVPQYAAQMQLKNVDPANLTQMLRGSLLAGSICAIIGAALIAIQKATDWKNREDTTEGM